MKGSLKKKLEYFWMYYKVPFLVILAVCAAGGYFLHAKMAEKETALQAMLLDIHTDVPEEELSAEFASWAGIDRKKYEVSIQASLLLSDASSSNYAMASLSKFQSMVGTKELDVCMMLEDDFIKYAGSGCFLDLREVFPEEELAASLDLELYVDADGQVLGIYGDSLAKIQEIGGYEGKESIVGIIYNSERTKTAAEFLRFLKME